MNLKVSFLLSDTKIRLNYLFSYFKDLGFLRPILGYFVFSTLAYLLRNGEVEVNIRTLLDPFLLGTLLYDGILNKNIEALSFVVMIILVYCLITWFFFYKILMLYDLVVSYLLFKLSLLSTKREKYLILNSNKSGEIKYNILQKKIFGFIKPIFDDLLTENLQNYIKVRLEEYKGSLTSNSDFFMPLIVSFIPSKNYNGFFHKLWILIKYIWFLLLFFIFKMSTNIILASILFVGIAGIVGFFILFRQFDIDTTLLEISVFLQEIMQSKEVLMILGLALVLYLLKRFLNINVKTLLLMLFWTLVISLLVILFYSLSELIYLPFITYNSAISRDIFLLVLFLPLLYFIPKTRNQYFIYLCYLLFFLTASSNLGGLGLYLYLVLFFSFKEDRSLNLLHFLVIALLMVASWLNPVFLLLKILYILFLFYTDYDGNLNISDFYRTAIKGKYSTLILKYISSVRSEPKIYGKA